MRQKNRHPVWFMAAAHAPIFAAAPVFMPMLQAQSPAEGAARYELVMAGAGSALLFQAAMASDIDRLFDTLVQEAEMLGDGIAAEDAETLKLKDSLSRMLEANKQRCPNKDKSTRTS